ncbi:hypothetical protein Acid345_4465 [Candidatus Koribacter versatilis Ellin345]|uniref:Uncharacterized protein n=1 Tax=Koribacter versatilis (strain Ellin345) TaxID=204669 RepID=Q1II35_KORVE|nr:hypothetical protein [Candidatus Koribacter versatilis]ABF43465.1 hypothetical protein Acid345_4465 [Candidatus Koribacter versatilis Ellin345]
MPGPTPNLRFVHILRGTLILLMAGLVPAVLLTAYFAQRYIVWVLGVFAGGLLMVRFAFQLWPCPRCGKPFFRSGTWAGPNMFTKRCMHCQLSEAEDAIPSITEANKPE